MGFHVDEELTSVATFLHDVKEYSGLLFDTHQLGVLLKFDVDVKILLLTSNFDVDVTHVKTVSGRTRQVVFTLVTTSKVFDVVKVDVRNGLYVF